MFLLIFESIGAPELLVILVVALIIFGPRKLPQLSRSLGKSLAEFRRASDEFKRTWEREVELETTDKEGRVARAMLPEDNSILDEESRGGAVLEAAGRTEASAEPPRASEDSPAAAVPPADTLASPPATEEAVTNAPTSQPQTSKRDWL